MSWSRYDRILQIEAVLPETVLNSGPYTAEEAVQGHPASISGRCEHPSPDDAAAAEQAYARSNQSDMNVVS